MSRIPYTNKVGETLGSIADPAAAYSLRALNGGDPMVARVRRSSDDAEKDFTASDVNGGALVNWVGSGNDGFVTTWYDQSGNDNDYVLLVASNQPKVITSGSLVNLYATYLDGYPSSVTLADSNLYEDGIILGSPNLFSPTEQLLIYTQASNGTTVPPTPGIIYHTGEQAQAGWYDINSFQIIDDYLINPFFPIGVSSSDGKKLITWEN